MDSISVGICAHNEEETIGELLNQALNEDIPVEEIIVVTAGEDSTADIVKDKTEKYSDIILIEEETREGQSSAQNKILSQMNGNTLLMLDGDGTIKPGSLEELCARFEGDNLIAGREVPVTDDSFLGRVLDAHGQTHHHLCEMKPRFTTQISIIPSYLVDQIPEIVLDDAYIEHLANEENLPLIYEKDAVKYHNLPSTFRFFFHQQKKNWAGRLQIKKEGYHHNKPRNLLLKAYIEQVKNSFPKQIMPLAALGLLEAAAYLIAQVHRLTGKFPVKWWRPDP